MQEADEVKRIMLDASVYGKLIEEPEVTDRLAKKIPNEIVVYGSEVIRKELREDIVILANDASSSKVS